MDYGEYATITEAMRPEPNTPEWKEYWKKNIEIAQQVTTYLLVNDFGVVQPYPRIPYGKEERYDEAARGQSWAKQSWDKDCHDHPCHDCNVVFGQLHVPGCDIEECPRCKWQAISCSCDDEEDDDQD